MQFKSTAKDILEASLRDIKAGRWTCGELACSKLPTAEGGEEFFKGKYIPEDEPMGCALGLISTHGGHGLVETVTFRDKEWESFTPAYPGHDYVEVWIGPDETHPYARNIQIPVGEASDAVIEARDALADAIPEEFTEIDDEGWAPLGDIESLDELVFTYNDDYVGDPTAAMLWFENALML